MEPPSTVPGVFSELSAGTAETSRRIAGVQSRKTVTAPSYREVLAIALLVALFNATIFNGRGYAGAALGLVLAPLLLWAGSPQRRSSIALGVIGALLAILALRMVWLGTAPQGFAGVVLIAAFALALTGRTPFVLDTLLMGVQSVFAAAVRLGDYRTLRRSQSSNWGWHASARFLMPAAAISLFGLLFIRANPDLADSFDRWAAHAWEWWHDTWGNILPTGAQLLWWGIVAWLSIGLLRPLAFGRALGWLSPAVDAAHTPFIPTSHALITAYRNTLLSVVVLFIAYLVFEFKTLWFREFPAGFYYSGYAHQGAAWLTAALALSTFVLSAIFRGSVLDDPRLPSLQRLAWIWSVLNLVLAVAVFHRLWIYVGFNGMTRMRTVAYVGVATVVAGFLLVIWKIARRRDLGWLIERQLWALAMGLYLLAALPMDAMIHRYNVRRVLAGDPAPVVQITEHDVDASGLATLEPLLDSDDAIIRNGVQALLAREWQSRSKSVPDLEHWTAYQHADVDLRHRLDRLQSRLSEMPDADVQQAAWERFRNYAYQWY